MNRVKLFVICQLIFIPYCIYVLADDANHPERWDLWYRNPNISIPFCVACEIFITGGLFWVWQQNRRREKGWLLVGEAKRLLDEGRYAESKTVFEEAKRLLRMDQ
jgi:hypothetical protein